MTTPFSEQLRTAAEPHWSAAVGHRFTRELADDTLSDPAYARYLMQDYLFLDVLVRVVAHAIAAAPAMPAQSKLAAFLAAVTSEENDYFLRSFEALGVTREAWSEAEPDAVTQQLAAHMLDAARSGYAEALAVLLPAEWIYLSWASAVNGATPARFYLKEWVDLHTAPEFAAFVGWLRAEVDRTGSRVPPARQTRLTALFREMAALEVAFFDAAYRGS